MTHQSTQQHPSRTCQHNLLYLSIDSSDMVPHWDTAVTAMWGSIDNEYAVLSTAVPDISTLSQNVNDRWEVPHVCQAGISTRLVLCCDLASCVL